MANLDFEKQMPDGSWGAVELPIVDMVCHMPAGTYRPIQSSFPAGVRLQGSFAGHETISCSVGYFAPPVARKSKRHKEVFWARPWK